MNRVVIVVLVCCGLVVTGGCLGLVDSDGDDESDIDDGESMTVPDEITDGEDVEQALEATAGDLESLSLEGEKVQYEPLPYGGGTEEMTTTYAADVGTGYVATIETNESIYRAGPAVDTERQLSNSSVTWHYLPQLETAVELSYGPEQPRELRIRGWLEDARLDYHGTEEIAGHGTHRVTVQEFETDDVPSAFEQADELEFWLDDEYWYPVEHRLVLNADTDRERVERTTHTALELDAEIDPDRFAFEPPSHVTVQDQSALSESSDTVQQSFDDIGAAEEEVPFEIATLESVPTGYERDGISVADPMLTVSATVSYGHPDGSSVDVTTQVTRPEIPADATELEFDDREAYAYEGACEETVIAWTCDRLWGIVTGEQSVEELQLIAAETPCY